MEKCEHIHANLTLTPELTHHGKYTCRDCGKFLGWAKQPKTIAREAAVEAKLNQLAKLPNLTEWEAGFVASLKRQFPKLSPPQLKTLDEVHSRKCGF